MIQAIQSIVEDVNSINNVFRRHMTFREKKYFFCHFLTQHSLSSRQVDNKAIVLLFYLHVEHNTNKKDGNYKLHEKC